MPPSATAEVPERLASIEAKVAALEEGFNLMGDALKSLAELVAEIAQTLAKGRNA